MARYVRGNSVLYLGFGYTPEYVCPIAVRAAREQLLKRRHLDIKQGKYDIKWLCRVGHHGARYGRDKHTPQNLCGMGQTIL